MMEMRQSTVGHKCQRDYSGEQLKTMILNMELAYGVHVENADDSNCLLKGTHLLVIAGLFYPPWGKWLGVDRVCFVCLCCRL